MKIKIEFTQQEKEKIINIIRTSVTVKDDEDKHTVGAFGETKYDSTENVITMDLKTGFVVATAHVLSSCANMIKALMNSLDMYSESWLNETTDLTKKEEEKEPQNPYKVVAGPIE
jgi:hypothetical protein